MFPYIDMKQTSSGFGVPRYEYAGEGNIHFEWAQRKRSDGLHEYLQANNIKSIDDLPTKLSLH